MKLIANTQVEVAANAGTGFRLNIGKRATIVAEVNSTASFLLPIKEMHEKLEKEVYIQLIDQNRKLREVAENATVSGSVKSVEFDNQSFYVEFGEGTRVSIGKVMDGAKKLGYNQGEIKLESNIVKIGSKKVEFKIEKGGERNYIDLSDESAFDMIF